MRAPNKNNVLRKLDNYITEISKLDKGTNTDTVLSLLQENIRIQAKVDDMSNLEA